MHKSETPQTLSPGLTSSPFFYARCLHTLAYSHIRIFAYSRLLAHVKALISPHASSNSSFRTSNFSLGPYILTSKLLSLVTRSTRQSQFSICNEFSGRVVRLRPVISQFVIDNRPSSHVVLPLSVTNATRAECWRSGPARSGEDTGI